MAKSIRGGQRAGAGRKPLGIDTKTISFRVRTEWEDIIKDTVKRKMKKLNNTVLRKKVGRPAKSL